MKRKEYVLAVLPDPEPHPTFHIFRKHEVPYWRIAIALNYSEQSVQRWLKGIRTPPPAVDRQLHWLAESLDEAAAGRDLIKEEKTACPRCGKTVPLSSLRDFLDLGPCCEECRKRWHEEEEK